MFSLAYLLVFSCLFRVRKLRIKVVDITYEKAENSAIITEMYVTIQSSLTIIYLIFILSINMMATGKKPQRKIPYEIREDPSDSVASTSQVKSLLRKQVQVLRHILYRLCVIICLCMPVKQ